MFSESSVEISSFLVTPRSERDEEEVHCQTAELVTNEKEIQTRFTKDFPSQTETIGLNESPHYDVDKLASFLRRIYPDLIEELDKVGSAPLVMKQYHALDEEDTLVNLHSIELEDIQEKIVSSLSFSSDGKYLAVAFSVQNHESWCLHSGEIHVYKINLVDYSAFPIKYISKTNSCVNHVSFHPSLPSHLACGLYNGTVFVWSLMGENLEQSFQDIHSAKDEHSDSVNSISWLSNSESFVTSGRDGVIIHWNHNKDSLTRNCSYFISSKYVNPEKTINDHAEILDIGMWKSTGCDQFIVGTEGGNILHCSLSKSEISKIPHRPGFYDPFIMKYEAHKGIITCIACCGKDIFATCTANYEIQVYKSREKVPLHVIYTNFPVIGMEWFEGISSNLACWGYGPSFYFSNIKTKDWLKSYSLRFKNPDSKVTAVAVSQNRPYVIAVSTNKGEISIWMLPGSSCTD